MLLDVSSYGEGQELLFGGGDSCSMSGLRGSELNQDKVISLWSCSIPASSHHWQSNQPPSLCKHNFLGGAFIHISLQILNCVMMQICYSFIVVWQPGKCPVLKWFVPPSFQRNPAHNFPSFTFLRCSNSRILYYEAFFVLTLFHYQFLTSFMFFIAWELIYFRLHNNLSYKCTTACFSIPEF